jgi:hypothetical protein
MATFEEYLAKVLLAFDSMDLQTGYNRRVAVKPLYDYYQAIVLEVSVHFCGFDRNSVKNQHLKTRWTLLKVALSAVDDPRKWDLLIGQIQNARESVEHGDYEVPATDALKQVRKQATELKEWLMSAGRSYFEASKGFSFVQEYSVLSHWYIGLANSIIDTYGENQPYFIDIADEYSEYKLLNSVKQRLEERDKQIQTVADLEKDDLKDLIRLIKIVEHVEAKESAFLRFSKCPKCGGNIVENEASVGENAEDSEPSTVLYRVGCEKCDYTVHEETIDI